jgi:carbon storage regulator CsrA
MLVLSRKLDEKIMLNTEDGQKIEITVVRIESNKVRIGIEAGQGVTILRSELLERTKKPANSPRAN